MLHPDTNKNSVAIRKSRVKTLKSRGFMKFITPFLIVFGHTLISLYQKIRVLLILFFAALVLTVLKTFFSANYVLTSMDCIPYTVYLLSLISNRCS